MLMLKLAEKHYKSRWFSMIFMASGIEKATKIHKKSIQKLTWNRNIGTLFFLNFYCVGCPLGNPNWFQEAPQIAPETSKDPHKNRSRLECVWGSSPRRKNTPNMNPTT